jgi:hypothetical protein
VTLNIDAIFLRAGGYNTHSYLLQKGRYTGKSESTNKACHSAKYLPEDSVGRA